MALVGHQSNSTSAQHRNGHHVPFVPLVNGSNISYSGYQSSMPTSSPQTAASNQSNNSNNASSSSNGNSNVNSSPEPQPDRPIGYGAFGVVWAVTDPRDGRRVALKKMPNVFQSLVACRRVFRELKMLTHFNHENVIHYFIAEFYFSITNNCINRCFQRWTFYSHWIKSTFKKCKLSQPCPEFYCGFHLHLQLAGKCELIFSTRIRLTVSPCHNYWVVDVMILSRA